MKTNYEPRNFDHLLGTPGFSQQLLNNHFKLYQGYVKNTNALNQAMQDLLQQNKGAGPEFAELKRRCGWEFNGMRLHEYYFENMTREPQDPAAARSALEEKFKDSFGSYSAWEKDFRSTGSMRGIGWAILYADPHQGRLLNVWINEHDQGHPAGCAPLLIMDVFEHAFMLDYGLKREEYIEAFFKAIHWEVVLQRMEAASRNLISV